jgi:hypothetical protein
MLMDACADVADTLGIKYAVSISGIPPGGEALQIFESFLKPVF